MQNGCKWRAPHRVGWTAAEVFAYSYGASLRGYLEASNNLTYADVAQLVEHHLAKVRVAGSSPVIRSEEPGAPSIFSGGLAERLGTGLQSR